MPRLANALLVASPNFATGRLTISARSIDALRAARGNPLHLLAAHEVFALDDAENLAATEAGGTGRIESLIVLATVVGHNARFSKFVVVTDLKVGETTIHRPSEVAP